MDLFARLAQQALEPTAATAVQPRLPARFETGGILAHNPAVQELGESIMYDAPSNARARSAALSQPAAPAESSPEPAARQPAGMISAPVASKQTLTPQVQPHSARPQLIAAQRLASETPGTVASVTPAIAGTPTPDAPAPRANSGAITPRRAAAIVPALAQPPLPAPRARANAAPPAPVIRVSIGRVEVRAVTRPAAPAPRPAPAPQPASGGLEDYLRADKGGRSR